MCVWCVCVCWQAKHSEYECEKQKAESVLQHYRDRVGEIDSIISSVEKKVFIHTPLVFNIGYIHICVCVYRGKVYLCCVYVLLCCTISVV